MKLLAIGLAAAMAVESLSHAAPAPNHYRLIDIRSLGSVQAFTDNTFGINADGAIAGTFQTGGRWHAFVWLPGALYGMSAGFHDLHTSFGLDAQGPTDSAANDISDTGLVVGVINGVGLHEDSITGSLFLEGEAAVWTLAATATLTPLGFLSGGDASVAHGINNLTPPTIVGAATRAEISCTTGNPRSVPFRLVFDPPSMMMQELPQNHTDSAAYDVNSASPTPRISGANNDDCPGIEFGQCDSDKDAAFWSGVAAPTILTMLPNTGAVREHAGHGVNGNGDIVGFGTLACSLRAGVWEAPSMTPINLHEVGTPLPPAETSIAEAANSRDTENRFQIVGSNTFTNQAMRWHRDPGSPGDLWSRIVLKDLGCAPCAEGRDIWRSHDINENGWIVGYGLDGPDFRLFLLIPLDDCPAVPACTGDLDGDGVVDGKDLGNLLANWSIPTNSLGCQGAANCPSDLNCDGVVDGIDLGILLANWDCGASGLAGPQMASMSSAPPSLEELVASLIELGFTEEAVLLIQEYPYQ